MRTVRIRVLDRRTRLRQVYTSVHIPKIAAAPGCRDARAAAEAGDAPQSRSSNTHRLSASHTFPRAGATCSTKWGNRHEATRAAPRGRRKARAPLSRPDDTRAALSESFSKAKGQGEHKQVGNGCARVSPPDEVERAGDAMASKHTRLPRQDVLHPSQHHRRFPSTNLLHLLGLCPLGDPVRLPRLAAAQPKKSVSLSRGLSRAIRA